MRSSCSWLVAHASGFFEIRTRQDAARILESFAAAGGNFLDTANHYAGCTSRDVLVSGLAA